MEMMISCFCVLANFGCVNGLYVVLDFAIDLLMVSLIRYFVASLLIGFKCFLKSIQFFLGILHFGGTF